MVICRLSALLGERRIKVADVVRDTGIARATVDRYYYDTVQSYDREVLDKLCAYLKIDLPTLIQYVRQPDLFDGDDTNKPALSKSSQYPTLASSTAFMVQETHATYAARDAKPSPTKPPSPPIATPKRAVRKKP